MGVRLRLSGIGKRLIAMLDTPASVACALLAITLSGLSKGGFAGIGALTMPVMVLANPPLRSAAVLLPILIVQDAIGVFSFRRTWNRQVLMLMVPAMTLGVYLGYLFAAHVREELVLAAVGMLSMLFGLHRLWREWRPPVRDGQVRNGLRPGWSLGAVAGIASGFTSQVAHAGAPPFQMWVLSRDLPRDELVGTTALAFAYMNLIKVPAFFALGQFSADGFRDTLLLLPVALLTTSLGVALVRRVEVRKFYKIIYLSMAVIGAKLSLGLLA
jgi:uncharacterized membrane protein YfcA